MAEAIYGFIYIEQSIADSLDYQEGKQVDIVPSELPYLVHYDIATITVNEWPGQLWFVEVLDNLATTTAIVDLETIPTRSFKPLKLLANSFLFGTKGEGVCLLLNRILELNLTEVQQLASLYTPIGAEAYAVAWSNWLEKKGNPIEHREADHTGALAIGKGEDASPIYSGFLVLNDLIYKKADELEGELAFVYYSSYGESERFLNPQWNKACSVLLQAAMALGAEQYVATNDLKFLLAGWHQLTKC